MKKHLLTIMLALFGMTAWAQVSTNPDWVDPSDNYHEFTVVYAKVVSSTSRPSSNLQIAAFMQGEDGKLELRGLTNQYQTMNGEAIFTIMVGGTSEDYGKGITFKLYDYYTKLVYPIELLENFTYEGDMTMNEPSSAFDFNVNFATTMKVFEGEAEISDYLFETRVNEETAPVKFDIKFYHGDMEVFPEYSAEWVVSEAGGAYVKPIENEEGFAVMGIGETPDNDGDGINDEVQCVTLKVGKDSRGVSYFSKNFNVKILPEYIPVKSIAIQNINEYWQGYGRLSLNDVNVTYNNGESTPTNPGVSVVSSSNTAVASIEEGIIVYKGIGTTEIKVRSIENSDVETTFTLNIRSALESIELTNPIETLEIVINGENEVITNAIPEIKYNYILTEDGLPVIAVPNDGYMCHITSEDQSVVLVGEDGTLTACKKGSTVLNFTSVYDPSKTIKLPIVIKRNVDALTFTINGNDYSTFEKVHSIDVTVGDEITAVATVSPADADFSEFEFKFINADGEDIIPEAEIADITKYIEENVLTYTFKFINKPQTTYKIYASVLPATNKSITSPEVTLNVFNKVEGIDIVLDDVYWFDANTNTIDIDCSVTPTDVLDRKIAIESSAPEIAEIVQDANYGCHINVYQPGTVTFTFTSVANPDIKEERTVEFKRTPDNVRIVSVGGETIEQNPTTTPSVNIAVGEQVVAIAQVEPKNATVEIFEMQVLNSDRMPVNVSNSSLELSEDGTTCTYTFTILEKPLDEIVLQAKVNDEFFDIVGLNVVQGVTRIELSETQKTIWFNSDAPETFEIGVKVMPDNASNKNYTVSISPEGVLEDFGEGQSGHMFRVSNKGEATITFTSADNSSVSATCEIIAKKKVNSISINGFEPDLYNNGITKKANIVYTPADADFELDALDIKVEVPDATNLDWEYIRIDISNDQSSEEGTVPFSYTGRSFCTSANVIFTYNGEIQGDEVNIEATETCRVLEMIELSGGWNWKSFVSGSIDVSTLSQGNFVEARSRKKLVYNDSQWGLFGALEIMDNSEAYKIKMSESSYAIIEKAEWNYDGNVVDKVFIKGWNWVSYPYEYQYPLGDIFIAANFEEGDMILSQNGGFVLCTDGVWEGSLEYLTPGEGYMIYTNSAKTLQMPNRYDMGQLEFTQSTQAQKRSQRNSVWVYDANRFANIMAIVGKVDVEDTERYSIAAFVGEECRGIGKFVNGKAYITAAGENGEVVTFRLHDEFTNEFLDIETSISFTDKAGSAKAPVPMGVVNGTTGITSIDSIDEETIEAIYDMSGREVKEMTSGLYIVKLRVDGKTVTKKIRK